MWKAKQGEVEGKRVRGLGRAAWLGVSVATVLMFAVLPLQAQTGTVRAAADSSAKTLADLPPAILPAISSALGHDGAQYGMHATADGYTAQNAANHLAAHYTAEGVEIRSQNDNWGLEFQGWGYGEHPENGNKAAVAPSVNANRIEYRRGALTEWYANGPLGIEQGFTISQPPVTRPGSSHDALDIALRLRGNLNASIESGRHALTLRDQKGAPALRYGPLLAYDASGRELESWMEVQDSSLRLRVNTAGARYPILVDPWVQVAKLTASDGAEEENLGYSISVSGNTVVVGAYHATIGGNAGQGTAYVFVEPAGGWAPTSTFNAKLTASDGAPGDCFGWSVGISGNTVVVGAPSLPEFPGCSVLLGEAYVFVEPGAGWDPTTPQHEAAKLTSTDVAAGDEFGYSVGVGGTAANTVVVGAPGGSLGSSISPGAAYVFVEPGAGWASENQTSKLTASNGMVNDALGSSVAINENASTVAAGAPGVDSTQGAAYVFVEPAGASGWASALSENQTAELTTTDLADTTSVFGSSVGISGSTVVVGASSANAGLGAAYVFVEPTSTGWVTTSTWNAKLTASDGAGGPQLGSSVSISGNTIVAGAPGANIGSNEEQGAAYVFVEPAGGWASENETAKLIASDGAASDSLGISVGISGNTVVAGASAATIGSSNSQGAAYVFTPGTGGPFAQYSNIGPIDFGSVQVNTTGSQQLTLTNTGSPAFMLTGITLQGSSSAFSITSVVCNSGTVSPPYASISVSLGMGQTCTFILQFLPTVNQSPYAEDLVFATTATNSNAGAGPGGTGQAILLNGEGVEPFANYTNSTSGSPTQIAFGNVVENTTSTQTLTLSNTGTGPLVLQGTAVSPVGVFSYTQLACNPVSVPLPLLFPFTINAGVSCIFTMQFDPNASGALGGAVSFVDNAGTGESNLTVVSQGPNFGQAVQLSGTGVAGIATTTTITSSTSSSHSFPFPPNDALVDGPPVTVNFKVVQASGSTAPTGTVVVTDGFGDTCATTTLNSGAGTCTIPTITQFGGGTTTLTATYTVSTNGFLPSPPSSPVTENLVEILTPCAAAGRSTSMPTPVTQQTVITVCLGGNINVVPVVAFVTDCIPHEQCSVTVSPETPGAPLYTVTLTSTHVDAGVKGSLPNALPRRGPWVLTVFEFVALLSILMALQLARQKRTRLQLSCAAGVLCVFLLGGMSSCNGPAGAPPGNYTVDLTITAGQFQLVVPVTVTVPK
jgi:hypothetical protein